MSEGLERVARAFFERDTVAVARDLLGRTLVSRVGGLEVRGTIVETEAYLAGDSTSHARRGRTKRNGSMFEKPGTLYVYFTYGMHACMNLSTEAEHVGTAVLVRALRLTAGLEHARARRGSKPLERDLARGPARLCVALGVGLALDGVDTCAGDALLYVCEGAAVPPRLVHAGPRVGVRGDDRDVRAPLRFSVRGDLYVSAK